MSDSTPATSGRDGQHRSWRHDARHQREAPRAPKVNSADCLASSTSRMWRAGGSPAGSIFRCAASSRTNRCSPWTMLSRLAVSRRSACPSLRVVISPGRGTLPHARRSSLASWPTHARPHESALGKVLLTGPPDRCQAEEVIGVVENAYFSGRGTEGPPRYVFFSSAERPPSPGEATFYIRHHSGLEAMAPAVARAFARPTDEFQLRACARSRRRSRRKWRRSGFSPRC